MDINQLKDEMETLEKERVESEKNRINVDKELTNAANNTKKIEQVRCSRQTLCAVLHSFVNASLIMTRQV